MIIDAPFQIFQQFAMQLRVQYYTQNDGKTLLEDSTADVTFLQQVHSNTVVILEGKHGKISADAAICTTKNFCLGVYFADCQNFVLYAPNTHMIGIVHAGAKGLDADIISEFFARSVALGIQPHEWYIGGGPSLCYECAEFTDPHRELPHIPKEYIRNRHVHLTQYAYDQFLQAGVLKENIEIMPDCTKCKSSSLFSYRSSSLVKENALYRNVLTICMTE